MEEVQVQKNSQRGTLRRQKGWKGFVHGYKTRREIFDKVWHTIDWHNDPKKCGAKKVESNGKGKIVYTF